jgi:hypothetical protein
MVRITNELMTLDELQEAGYLKGLETGDMIICKKSDFLEVYSHIEPSTFAGIASFSNLRFAVIFVEAMENIFKKDLKNVASLN